MKARLLGAAGIGAGILIAALGAPPGAERAYFAGLFAPAIVALGIPLFAGKKKSLAEDGALVAATGLAAFLALAGFCWKHPGVPAALGLAGFLVAWAVLLLGIFRAGLRVGPGFAQLAATGLGLFLCATHLLADPVVLAVEDKPSFRKLAIGLTLDLNPSLVASAAFWERDALHTSYGYAQSAVGSYYSYSYPSGWLVALGYLAAGAALWAAGTSRKSKAFAPRESPAPAQT